MKQLYRNVQEVIETSRATAYRAANASMVQAYWNIGRLILEEEQRGDQRAEYGKQIVEGLAQNLQAQYGKGYNKGNLWYMRQFYQSFKILHALRGELSWTHYRLLLKLEKEEARQFYVAEAIACNWNTRTLEKQINNLYYERMLMSGKEGQQEVRKEEESKRETIQPKDIIKDPYLLDLLNLQSNHTFYERELEGALINKLQDFLLGKGFSFVSSTFGPLLCYT